MKIKQNANKFNISNILRSILALLLVFALTVVSGPNVYAEEIEIVDEETELEMVSEEEDTQDESQDEFQEEPEFTFVLSPVQYEEKAELLSHLDEISEAYSAGKCVPDELLIYADDEETATLYAEAFGGMVERYEYGLAVVKLTMNEILDENDYRGFDNILEAITASADPDINLPAAWPNYMAVSDLSENLDGNSSEVIEGYYEYDNNDEDIETSDDDADDMSLCGDGIALNGAGSTSYAYNDPYLNESNDNYQWQHYLVDSKAAWKAGYIGTGVKVAILTSGVSGHTELSGLSGTNNTYKKAYYDNRKRGMVSGNAPDNDKDGIGTQIAGIIGAQGGNNLGGAGIAPGATLYVAGAYDNDLKVATTDSLFYSLQYAEKEWHPDVIDISICFYYYSKQIEDVINSLYNGGCVIFAPAGDDSSTQVVYPAGYANVVSVGAVDIDNKPAYFTNSNAKVRYSGPGIDITSCAKNSTSSFIKRSGTAQASAVVAGVAAVILSSGKISGSGSSKVNSLLALMDKGCIRSGLGKGSVNLAASLGLPKTTAAPQKPTATEEFVCFGENYDIEMYSEENTAIYYTLDGKTPSYKNGVVVGTQYDKTKKKVKIGGAAHVTLKMIAVNIKTGQVSPVATYKYDFEPQVSSVKITADNNTNVIAKGTSLQLKATVAPDFAKNKNVRWDVVNTPLGVRVDKTGKVTVTTAATVSNCTIKLSAVDGSNKTATYYLTIVDPAKKVTAIKPAKSSVTVTAGDGNTATTTMDVKITMSDKSAANSYFYVNWYSMDPSIASVTKLQTSATSTPDVGSIRIQGVKAGKTTIYGIAGDGSGIKAKVAVTVKQYATGVTVSGPKGDILQIGKVASLSASLSPQGVTNKTVSWEMSGVPYDTTEKTCGVRINAKNGKVTAGRYAVPGKYSFVAIAKDRGVVKSIPYALTITDSVIRKVELTSYTDRIFRVKNVKGSKTSTSFGINIEGGNMSCITVTNSNPNLVDMTVSGNSVSLSATGRTTGSANITVATTDGTAIKKIFKINVSNPATRLYLSLPQGRSEYLAYGSKLTLRPNLLSEYGSLDASAKKYSWTSSNPDLIEVNASGVASVSKIAEAGANTKVTITCKTTDGSNLSATISLVPCGKTIKFQKEADPDNDRYRLESVCTLDGAIVGDDYVAKVNKSGLGAYVRVENKGASTEATYLYLQGQKKGNYTVTVSKRDGSTGRLNVSVIVDVYKNSEGQDEYILTLK